MDFRAGRRLTAALLVTLATAAAGVPTSVGAAPAPKAARIDKAVHDRIAKVPDGTVPVLVQTRQGARGVETVRVHGGVVRYDHHQSGVVAADVPAARLAALAAAEGVERIALDAEMRSQSVKDKTAGRPDAPAATGTPGGAGANKAGKDPVAGWARTLQTRYPRAVRAAELWTAPTPLRGTGIGVAVLDSGVDENADFAVAARVAVALEAKGSPTDDYGHGTYVAGIVAGHGEGENTLNDDGYYLGIAPGARIVSVKVSNQDGVARVSDVMAGIQWVIDHKDQYGIRVMNLSLVSSVAESYKTSLLDAYVELAWMKGIVVVVSVGNGGPDAVGYPPANDPYAIVVGATDDLGTAATADDRLASFSSYGTTPDGVVRPDLVAPGRRIVSVLSSTRDPLALEFPDRLIGSRYIRLSGTSAAAPVVSGIVAQVLQAKPHLTPNQVKWLLTHTALPVSGPGTGAGYPQAAAAVAYAGVVGQANVQLPPNTYIVQLALTAAGKSGATSDWNASYWHASYWDASYWDTAGWDASYWDTAAWEASYWDASYWDATAWNANRRD